MIPTNLTKDERLKWLAANKGKVMEAKKQSMKFADAVVCPPVMTLKDTNVAVKEEMIGGQAPDTRVLERELVINSCKWLDSHDDVHIPGLWKKSVSETKTAYLLDSHKRGFGDIISDSAVPMLRKMNGTDLGVPLPGDTEVLIFKVGITPERNPFMYKQYANNWVKQHSVGMRYVNLFMCVNSTEKYFIEEKENWDKYIDYVANKDAAEERGFFFAVTEAKLIEGSSVVFGSNPITPVVDNNKYEPEGTQTEPPSTQADQSKQEPSDDTLPIDVITRVMKEVLF